MTTAPVLNSFAKNDTAGTTLLNMDTKQARQQVSRAGMAAVRSCQHSARSIIRCECTAAKMFLSPTPVFTSTAREGASLRCAVARTVCAPADLLVRVDIGCGRLLLQPCLVADCTLVLISRQRWCTARQSTAATALCTYNVHYGTDNPANSGQLPISAANFALLLHREFVG